MKYQAEPKLPGKLYLSSNIASSTDHKLILELYHVIKTEINSKKHARLPLNDRRRLVVQSKPTKAAHRKFVPAAHFEQISLKKFFATFFTSPQVR